MSEKLKPCPFCGCKNIVVRKYTAVAGVHYYAQCDSVNGGCGANIDSRITKKSAVEAWNKRAGEVRHGEWIKREGDGAVFADYECSVCSAYPTGGIRSYYCPNCGAFMDREK